MPNLLTLLDVTPLDGASSSDHSSLIVGLMLAAAVFLWLAWYVPMRGEARRR